MNKYISHLFWQRNVDVILQSDDVTDVINSPSQLGFTNCYKILNELIWDLGHVVLYKKSCQHQTQIL